MSTKGSAVARAGAAGVLAVALGVAAVAGAQTTGAQSQGQQPQEQQASARQDDEESPWSIYSSLGFTLDPATFLLAFGGDYAMTEEFGIGPLLQLGLSDDYTIVALTANGIWGFDLREHVENETLRKLRPTVQGGLGFAHVDKDRGSGKDDDDTKFLINVGFGVEYPVTDHFSVGNSLMFNILPWNAAGENFFFAWQFATARFRF